mmetsp:Transcript_35617/g.90084  ORF Transcript_35617/g.90084 Transcript_35617/m.90084 type:complete len:266 (+) Transcript_35617:738-1535(+)
MRGRLRTGDGGGHDHGAARGAHGQLRLLLVGVAQVLDKRGHARLARLDAQRLHQVNVLGGGALALHNLGLTGLGPLHLQAQLLERRLGHADALGPVIVQHNLVAVKVGVHGRDARHGRGVDAVSAHVAGEHHDGVVQHVAHTAGGVLRAEQPVLVVNLGGLSGGGGLLALNQGQGVHSQDVHLVVHKLGLLVVLRQLHSRLVQLPVRVHGQRHLVLLVVVQHVRVHGVADLVVGGHVGLNVVVHVLLAHLHTLGLVRLDLLGGQR